MEHSLASSKRGARETTEKMRHCAHTQGLPNAKVEHWVNGAVRD